MKFKLLLATLAFFASTAQATTISTNYFSVDNDLTSDTVYWLNFNVTDGGFFQIYTDNEPYRQKGLSDPYIMLFKNSVAAGNYLAEDNNDGDGLNSYLYGSLLIGNYVLAVSNNKLTEDEAIARNNPGVDKYSEGLVKVTIKGGFDTDVAFGHKNGPSAVPVPAAAWLFGSALLGFAGFRRKSV